MKTLRIAAAVVLALGMAPLVMPAGAAPKAAPAEPKTGAKKEPRQIPWSELIPPGWDPYKGLRDSNVGALSDGSPQVMQLMREMRDVWDNAPTHGALNGAFVKLPGYVVPLEEARAGLKEFLLVPYFGACIHSPPPPSNQIVHVVAAKPAKGIQAMDTVWVTGVLKAQRQDSAMGVSGYAMQAATVDRYAPPAR